MSKIRKLVGYEEFLKRKEQKENMDLVALCSKYLDLFQKEYPSLCDIETEKVAKKKIKNKA